MRRRALQHRRHNLRVVAAAAAHAHAALAEALDRLQRAGHGRGAALHHLHLHGRKGRVDAVNVALSWRRAVRALPCSAHVRRVDDLANVIALVLPHWAARGGHVNGHARALEHLHKRLRGGAGTIVHKSTRPVKYHRANGAAEGARHRQKAVDPP